MTRRARVALTAVLGIAALGVACVGIFYLTDRDGWNKRAYGRISPGMSRAELVSVLGDRPDCVIAVGRSEAWFYRGALGEVSCQTRVPTTSDLPSLYGTLQILLGPDGRVIAVAMDGEKSLKTTQGTHSASTLGSVPSGQVE